MTDIDASLINDFSFSVHINYKARVLYRNIVEKAAVSALLQGGRGGGRVVCCVLFVVFVVLTIEILFIEQRDNRTTIGGKGTGLYSCFRFSRPAWFIELEH